MTAPSGSQRGWVRKFTAAQIAAIRRDGRKLGVRAAARKHGCSAPYVSDLLRGKRRPAQLRVRPLMARHYEKATGQLWAAPFWYGGSGELATEPAVVILRADYLALLRASRRPR